MAIADRIKPLLAGHPPEAQGAVLAELLSMWLAGHYQLGAAATERLLSIHIEMTRALMFANIEILKRRH